MILFVTLWLLTLPYVHAASEDAGCYYPDGSYAGSHVPCLQDTAANSVCCRNGYACLTNGICQATGALLKTPNAKEFVRGACTDQSWKSSACPLFCNVQNNDINSDDQPMAKCTDRPNDIYYCINKVNKGLGLNNCGSGQNLIYFKGNPEAITTIGSQPTSTISSSSSSQTSTSSTSSHSPSETSTATSNPSTQPTIEGHDEAAQANKRVVIGGAVGGGVGGLAIIGLLVWLFLKKRHTQQGNPKRASLFKNPEDDKANIIHEAPGWVPLKDLPGQVHEAPGWTAYKGEFGPDSYGQPQRVYEVP